MFVLWECKLKELCLKAESSYACEQLISYIIAIQIVFAWSNI